MNSLVRQLHDAFMESGWSVGRLLEKSKLGCDRTSLQRKIHGQQPLTANECDAIARALGKRVVVTPPPSRAV